MPGPIQILPLADHGNVATETRGGAQRFLAGWERGRIPLELQRKSEPVDVSALTMLRPVLSIESMTHGGGLGRPRGGYENGRLDGAGLIVSIEHARTPNGPWTLLHAFEPMRDPTEQHAPSIGSFESFVRASWFFARRYVEQETMIADQVAIAWSLTA